MKEKGQSSGTALFPETGEIKSGAMKSFSLGTSLMTATFTLLLVLTFFFPLWSIILDAPQYPEGLGMQIWINQMTGDLQTINGLNHYIGMQEIEPDSFKELKLMPYVIGGLMLIGLATAVARKRRMLFAFAIIFLIAGIAGGVDFWLWEYDYGHNLDPHAAIKIPGMSYQPPLIGGQQLLNFYAESWPAAGGWAVIIAGAGIVALAVKEFFTLKKLKKA